MHYKRAIVDKMQAFKPKKFIFRDKKTIFFC